MELLQCRIFKQVIVSVMIASLSVCSTSVISVADVAPVLIKEQKKEKVNNNEATGDTTITSEEPAFVVSEPSVTVESDTDGMTMLYVGGALGIVAMGAVVLGGGSGSSSDSGADPSLPDSSSPSATPLVGPDLNGVNWAGFQDIKDYRATGYQNIAASIVHSGSTVQITTTSTLTYGHYFSGSINSSGHMLMYDSITGEDWTTFGGNASGNRIDLYDYVNNLKDKDRMLLSR